MPRKQPTNSVKYRGAPAAGDEGGRRSRRMRPGEKALKKLDSTRDIQVYKSKESLVHSFVLC